MSLVFKVGHVNNFSRSFSLMKTESKIVNIDFEMIGYFVSLTPPSTVPEHAHFLCQDFDSGVGLALLQPLCDLMETIWVAHRSFR